MSRYAAIVRATCPDVPREKAVSRSDTAVLQGVALSADFPVGGFASAGESLSPTIDASFALNVTDLL
jgi:hypothetical protein